MALFTKLNLDRLKARFPFSYPERLAPTVGEINALITALNANLGSPVAVTQITNNSTAVTANSSSGVITTVALTTPADGSFNFTVNDSKVIATSSIQLTMDTSNITTGYPEVSVQTVANGSFVIKVQNRHPSSALGGLLRIHFFVA